MASQKQQYTVLYGRLSQEDERVGESYSILHQRDLLESYAQARALKTHCSLRMTATQERILNAPAGKKS